MDLPARVVIDTDPGVDDFLALVLALRSSELRVEALTTVGGNCPLRLATRNALRVLEYTGSEGVPVYAGAARPEAGAFRYAPYFHGPSGLTARMPRPRVGPASGPAVGALARLLASRPGGPLRVIALGPLTNIARLVRERPAAARNIGQLVIMGGALESRGNVGPGHYAEFNIWNDPEAADSVLRSGVPIRLIGLDVCNLVRLGHGDVKQAAPLIRRMMENWSALRPRGDRFPMCDPLAVAAVIAPRLFLFKSMPVRVLLDGAERGRTVAAADGPPVEVAVGVDVAGAFDLFRERLLGTPGRRGRPSISGSSARLRV